MVKLHKVRMLNDETIKSYTVFLYEQERGQSTIDQYARYLNMALLHFDGIALTKAVLIEWKEQLAEKRTPASVNTVLAALNGFLRFMGWADLTVKPFKDTEVIVLRWKS